MGDPDDSVPADLLPTWSRPFGALADDAAAPADRRAPSLATARVVLQAQLVVGRPDDPLEVEADRVADEVLHAPGSRPPSAPTTPLGASAEGGPAPVARRAGATGPADLRRAPAGVSSALSEAGAPLDAALQEDMEARFRFDFSQVRIHDGAAAARSTAGVGARAYTVGQQIVFGRGQWSPGTHDGQRLLAHELQHVVQQTPVSQRPAGVEGGRSSASPAADHTLRRQASGACHPTSRYPGNLEHFLIEEDFVSNVKPGGGAVEYAIPESGPNGGTGYADMVDLSTHRVYEIKTFLGAPGGVVEAQRYADKAEEHCPGPVPQAPWTVGNDYPQRVIAMPGGGEELVAQQYPQFPGVVVYYRRRRRLVPDPVPVPVPSPQPGGARSRDEEREAPRPVPVPVPVPVPQTSWQQIRDFLQRVVQSGQDVEAAARRFLTEHPELVDVIAGVAVGIFIATVVEDVLTLGAGIADDPLTMGAAWTLWRVAMAMRLRPI